MANYKPGTKLIIIIIIIIAPWSKEIPENLRGRRLVKKFHTYYGTRRFITAFTRAHQRFLS
jgi:prolipoprotein diacylglyceryltransferase